MAEAPSWWWIIVIVVVVLLLVLACILCAVIRNRYGARESAFTRCLHVCRHSKLYPVSESERGMPRNVVLGGDKRKIGGNVGKA